MNKKPATLSIAQWYQQGIRIFWLAGCSILLATDKFEFHRKINNLGTDGLDFFMRYYTHLGDGVFALSLAILSIIKNIRLGILLIISYGSSAIITQILKHSIFSEFHRPYYYFNNDESFHFINDFVYHSHHSFPSGHATSSFAIFTILAFYFENKRHYQIVLVLLAVSVAFSRVYLSQHFLQDIIAGSMIGYLCSLLCWFLFLNKLVSFDRPFRRN